MQLLRCHACIWPCLRAVTHRAPLATQNALVRRTGLQRTPSRTLELALQRRRTYATTVDPQPDAFDDAFGPGVGEANTQKQAQRDAFRRHREIPYYKSKLRRGLQEDTRESLQNPGHQALDPAKKRKLSMDLNWTGQDPLKLADTVRARLANGDVEKTTDLVRFASKSMDCVVAWNHLIDHNMAAGRCNQALKLYNEMKKRSQKPDSYTYMIVLRGIGNHTHLPSSVGNALAVYHSMSAPNSTIHPSTMHANAALRVCARANNMDAMWAVASKLPEKGPGAADATTYSTILKGMRQSALLTPHGMSSGEVAYKREEAIIDGRRIWEDIITKWRSGDIIIDENLACAMGRLLLIGLRPRDWDDVLSLFEQTMDIPRLVKHLGAGRQLHVRDPDVPRRMKIEDSARIDLTDNMRRGGEFDPIKPEKTVGGGRSNMSYARPGNPTLSIILESCYKMTSRRAAEAYWHLLTAPDNWGVAPDENNLHMYLRILRQTRSSAVVVDFLRTEFDGTSQKPKGKTFRMAMSTCVRDKNNPNVFAHANFILDLMAETLTDPDVRTLAMYANLLTSLPKADHVMGGLERLGPHYLNLKSMLNLAKKQTRGPAEPVDTDAALEFLSGIKSCYDRLLNNKEVPREHHSTLADRKAKIDAYHHRILRRIQKLNKEEVRNAELNPARRAEVEAEERRKEESMDQDDGEHGDEPYGKEAR